MNIIECEKRVDGRCVMNEQLECALTEVNVADWFDNKYEDPPDIITMQEVCKSQSCFGNNFICITADQLEEMRIGKVLHLRGEYGTFIRLETGL